MITNDQLQQVPGMTVYGSDGEKIGKAGQVYVDDDSGQPEWVTVNTGLFGSNESFVPLRTAEVSGDGLSVGYAKDVVKDAPNVDPDDGHLDRDEEQRLFQHYDLTSASSALQQGEVSGRGYDDSDDAYASEGDASSSGDVAGAAAQSGTSGTRGVEGHDTSGRTTDDAMTRSEERLDVGTETRETGRARLRKYVVTEEQNVKVPVTREEVKVEREPITDANRDDALSGPEISEEEHEVVLHEEQPVVEKEAVPVERVRLGKEQVTDEQTVTEQVRKEQVETEGDGVRDER